jgi:hypothetical protein
MDDYMNEGMDEGAAPEAPEPTDKEGARTALLPIDFFQGKTLEPGSTCSVKVEKVMEDQVSVSYVPHAQEEAEEAAPGGDEYLS